MDKIDSTLERLLISSSVSIYDGALWQLVLGLSGGRDNARLVDGYTGRMLRGSWGTLYDLRAFGPKFLYGDSQKVLSRDNGFFFRIISDRYIQRDPMNGETTVVGYPNFNRLHHEDWKPITGEQAWATILGPMQLAHLKYGDRIPMDSAEMRLALSVLTAFEAMRSPIGALYHAPKGTHQKDPDDISTENNLSAFAALKMFKECIGQRQPAVCARIDRLLSGIESYFSREAFSEREGLFYQGGHWTNGVFVPTNVMAVDCQTWALVVLGPEWIDRHYGKGAAWRIWYNTKFRSGYFGTNGLLLGVGFTDGHDVLSGEWTGGAIFAAKALRDYYQTTHPLWSREAALDAVSMRLGLETLRVDFDDGTSAYLYANRRYYIPFGWWANPIPSLASSTWAVFTDLDFNPFVLGGGPSFSSVPVVRSAEVHFEERKAYSVPWWEKTYLPEPAPTTGSVLSPQINFSVKGSASNPLRAGQTKGFDLPSLTGSGNRLYQYDVEEADLLPMRPRSRSREALLPWVLLGLLAILSGVFFVHRLKSHPLH